MPHKLEINSRFHSSVEHQKKSFVICTIYVLVYISLPLHQDAICQLDICQKLKNFFQVCKQMIQVFTVQATQVAVITIQFIATHLDIRQLVSFFIVFLDGARTKLRSVLFPIFFWLCSFGICTYLLRDLSKQNQSYIYLPLFLYLNFTESQLKCQSCFLRISFPDDTYISSDVNSKSFVSRSYLSFQVAQSIFGEKYFVLALW